MDFYEEASLVMVPSGYKDQKVYSSVPDDGSGDLTFSRASNATRVNSEGLVEKVRTNLVLQSNTFDTTWNAFNLTLASGQAGYDGSNNAWKLTAVGTGGGRKLQQATSGSGIFSFSVYAKAGTANYIALECGGTGGFYEYFNLTDGTDGAGVGNINVKADNVGNGWWRFTIAGNPSALSSVNIFASDTNNSTNINDGLYIYIQNAQLETGDIATDYIETTTAAVSVGPVSGLPRLNYDAVNPTSASLLLEPQRTNIATYSESFDNAVYIKSNNTITANATTSPDGYTNADKVIPTATSGFHSLDILPSVIVTTYTLSVFAKAGEYSKIALLTNNRGSNMARGFDLDNGTTFANDFGYSEPTSFSIENYGNGWYRCSITYPKTATGSSGNGIAVINDAGASTFAGNGTDGLFLYGFQMESDASYVSSYIPTLSSAVTRVADAAYKTGISSLIGQTEGTFFVQIDKKPTEAINLFELGQGTSQYRFFVYTDASNKLKVLVVDNYAVQVSFTSTQNIASGDKIAIGYKLNDYAIYLNGTQIGTDTSATVPPMNQLALGADRGATATTAASFSQFYMAKTRLSNDDLAIITSL